MATITTTYIVARTIRDRTAIPISGRVSVYSTRTPPAIVSISVRGMRVLPILHGTYIAHATVP